MKTYTYKGYTIEPCGTRRTMWHFRGKSGYRRVPWYRVSNGDRWFNADTIAEAKELINNMIEEGR